MYLDYAEGQAMRPAAKPSKRPPRKNAGAAAGATAWSTDSVEFCQDQADSRVGHVGNINEDRPLIRSRPFEQDKLTVEQHVGMK